ncbi:probable E3 ubiquitin-protein ligase RNF217 [Exaiptasia diaphana]|uniref:RBR-type E3 ubiquitin transferase n=1 Tax=Exaiptasia diaphana TaxID=2652724 RepID=A0A913WPA7_EXADI|nr:probable E3 ubiquitin-protein ligase RNF217 [Exaiptasia diaphana]
MEFSTLPPSYDCILGIYNVPCFVCYLHGSSSNAVMVRDCCKGFLCADCLRCHIETKIKQAIVKIVCPLEDCDSFVPNEEIKELACPELYLKFEQFLVDIEQNPNVKTCPNCSRIFTFEPPTTEEPEANSNKTSKSIERKKISERTKVTCDDCHLVWCFECQAPWHYGMTCKDFGKGDKSLKIWAKNKGQFFRNATRCPKCQIFIQKFAGCDHMVCTRCRTEFCYRCGCRFRSMYFLGDHHDPLSVFGCKYNYKPGSPTQRVLVRGAVLSGKLLALPFVAGLVASAGCIVLGAGVVIVPGYVSYRMIKKKKIKGKFNWQLNDNSL